MKRYIEIVFDDSSSMTEKINYEEKHFIAKELFKKNIAPVIGLPEDKVVLRLLRNSCYAEKSDWELLPNNFKVICQALDDINTFNKNTPLYKTVSDSISACKNENADEYHIFVLTDGGDNCNTSLESTIDQDDLRFITFMNVSTLVVQFTVDNTTTSNNLSGFAQFLKGRSVSIGNNGETDFFSMSKKLTNAIVKSGLSNSEYLPQCFKSITGNDKSWNQIQEFGYLFHLSLVLFNEDILSWQPKMSINVDPLQYAELEFLYSLFFKSGLSFSVAKAMLNKLQKPYYYSYKCIYWDFNQSKWCYFPESPQINIVQDDSVLNDSELSGLYYTGKNGLSQPFDIDISGAQRNTQYKDGLLTVKQLIEMNFLFQLSLSLKTHCKIQFVFFTQPIQD